MHPRTEESRIRLVLLDDHCLFRASLSRLLSSDAGFEVAGQCGTFAEALEVLSRSSVDVVLLELELGPRSGNDFISAARQAGYRGQFLLVAGAVDARSAAIALKLGALGILLKSEAPERLLHAIRQVADGEVWMDPRIMQMLAGQFIDLPRQDSHNPAGILEDRERNVLHGILAGLTNKKIGANLGLSEPCVKNLVQRLFAKAGVNKRSQLVRVALEGSLGTPRQLIQGQMKTPFPDQETSGRTRRAAAVNRPPDRQSHG